MTEQILDTPYVCPAKNENFSEFYLEYGDQLIPKLIENLEPLKSKFTIITIDDA